jgi:hypothetical protein
VTWLGLFWGLAVVSVLLPVVHFVLVPALLIAGPITALARYRRASGVLGGEGVCPECDALLTVESAADEWPFSEVCETCGAAVRIQKAAVAPEASPTS